jgi:hypothetical protein
MNQQPTILYGITPEQFNAIETMRVEFAELKQEVALLKTNLP